MTMYLASPLSRKAAFVDNAERTFLLDAAGGTVPARAHDIVWMAAAPGATVIDAEPMRAIAFVEARGREVVAVDLLASALDRSLDDDTRRSALKTLAGLVGEPAVMEVVRRTALNTFPSDPSWDPDGAARLVREVDEGDLAILIDAVRSSAPSARRLQKKVRDILVKDQRAPWRALIEERLFEGWLYADALGGRGDMIAKSDLAARVRSSLRALPAEVAEDETLIDDLAVAFAEAVRAQVARPSLEPVLRAWTETFAAPAREAPQRASDAGEDVSRRLAFDVGYLFAAAAALGDIASWEYLLDVGVAMLPGEPMLWDAKIACRVYQKDNVGAWAFLKNAVEHGLSVRDRSEAGYIEDFGRARHMGLLVLDNRTREAVALEERTPIAWKDFGGFADLLTVGAPVKLDVQAWTPTELANAMREVFQHPPYRALQGVRLVESHLGRASSHAIGLPLHSSVTMGPSGVALQHTITPERFMAVLGDLAKVAMSSRSSPQSLIVRTMMTSIDEGSPLTSAEVTAFTKELRATAFYKKRRKAFGHLEPIVSGTTLALLAKLLERDQLAF